MATLYYCHDPMCSWCWAFAPVWRKTLRRLPTDIRVEYLLGGLAPDTDELMPKQLQAQIQGYWRTIEIQVPGTRFNHDFWRLNQPRRSSYPACRAVIAARQQDPDMERPMIKAIQGAYYLEAQNPSNHHVLIQLAQTLRLDAKQFAVDLNSDQTQQLLDSEILFSRHIGATGFPSLILAVDQRHHSIALDYHDERTMLSQLKEFCKNN